MRILTRDASSWLRPTATIFAILAPAAVGTGNAAGAVLPIEPSPAPPALTATLIPRPPNTLRPGRVVRSRDLVGERVFVDDAHGFALANVGQAQYPAATVNGGRTWRLSGPALHVNAAQAPLVVCEIGALSRRTYWAAGCGGQAVDITNDGGRHWWRTIFEGGVFSVVSYGPRLLALVEEIAPDNTTTTIQAFTSADKGRSWQYESRL